MSKTDIQARLAYGFANVERLTRNELIDLCVLNDPNGCYRDDECTEECGRPITTDELRAIVREWTQEDGNCEPVHLLSTQICVDYSSTTKH